MGIEISGNSGRPPHEAVDAAKSQTASQTGNTAQGGGGATGGATGADRLQLSNQAAQLQALEAEISKLPVVDTQRVQDVQRTLATGSYQVDPTEVADRMLTFEVGLDKA